VKSFRKWCRKKNWSVSCIIYQHPC